jgi:NAD-dependent deacetylase
VNEKVIALARALEGAVTSGGLLAVTGAGVSAASGIPTFRGTDEGAIWKHDVLEMATLDFFLRQPEESWRWYLSRFDNILHRDPNAAHHALVAMERWYEEREADFLLVSQNIDPLHERAGSRALVKIHGSAERVRCSRRGCSLGSPHGFLPRAEVEGELEAFRRDPRRENVPRCSQCGALVRPHVLWFDEHYHDHADYQFDRALAAAESAGLFLFVGTSFAVGITDVLLRSAAWRGAPAISVDPGAARPPDGRVEVMAAPAEALLPAVCEALGA